MNDKPFNIFVGILVIIILTVVILWRKKDKTTDNYDEFGRRGGRRGGGYRPIIRRPIIYGGNPYIYPPPAILTLDKQDQDEKDLEIERLKKELKDKHGSKA